MAVHFHIPLWRGTLKVKPRKYLRAHERRGKMPVWRIGGICFVWQPSSPVRILHPGYVARTLRALRFLRGIPGWGRIVNLDHPLLRRGRFVINNHAGAFYAGSLASLIDRQVYFLDGYERAFIGLFIGSAPKDRRRNVLDIGANAGTHSLAFSRAFRTVHSFEPNSLLWQTFARNRDLNPAADIRLYRVGLGSKDGEFPFFNITPDGNFGMGTFLDSDHYGERLQPVGTATIAQGDLFLRTQGIQDIDAIKIDVQGLEADVLRGLQETLAQYQPLVWMEVSTGTLETAPTFATVQALFPYPITLDEMVLVHPRLDRHAKLRPAPMSGPLSTGDYLVRPDKWRRVTDRAVIR